MRQEEGLIGRLVGAMIRSTIRKRFHSVYWRGFESVPKRGPVVFVCSHHGWHDGYLMYCAVQKLGLVTLDWIAEYDAFPLFGKVGGLPFPPRDHDRRIQTIRTTIRLMQDEHRSLLIFGDGQLRRPHEPWEIGRAVETIAAKVPKATLIPVAIVYEMSTHERPTAWISFGSRLDPSPVLRVDAEQAIRQLIEETSSPTDWSLMTEGAKDVNERMDMRSIPGRTSRERR